MSRERRAAAWEISRNPRATFGRGDTLLSPAGCRFWRMIGHKRTAFSKKLLIVDDQLLVAQGLACVLQDLAPGWLCVPATSCAAACREAGKLRPDVVVDPLLSEDVRFQSIRRFAATHPWARLVFLDDRFRPSLLRVAIRIKACGYWTKQSDPEEIVRAIRIAACGEGTACPEAEPYITRAHGRIRFRSSGETNVLTPRELAVVRLLAQGLPVKDCSKHLRLSPNTVDNHKSRVMRKLGLRRLGALMLWAVREGLA